VDVVRHDDEGVQFDMPIMIRQGGPAGFDQSPEGVGSHSLAIDFAEDLVPALDAESQEIGAGM
jgi:hypothetical protein